MKPYFRNADFSLDYENAEIAAKDANSKLREWGLVDAIELVMKMRGQWIHTVHKEEALSLLKRFESGFQPVEKD